MMPHTGSPTGAGTPATAEVMDYWDRRACQFARRGAGLAAVCSYGMPAFYNRAIALTQRYALAPWLRHVSARRRDGSPASVLDVGCGVGRWSLQLAQSGCRVTGVDISSRMIEIARNRAVATRDDCEFIVANAAELDLRRQFDFILCVTVLQHILDSGSAHRAIERMAAHLAPGGTLVLLEAAPSQKCTRCDNAVFNARPLEWYFSALRSAALRVVTVRGVDPIPFKIWLLPYYQRLPRLMRLAALALATTLSLPLDLALAPIAPAWSWHKVVVGRRVGE
jgi:2-polyprenyl-3-methyl-5-hydroxy-6-metoxy-1,4-benzoquinol methylase